MRAQFHNFEDPEWKILKGILERKVGDRDVVFVRVGIDFWKDFRALRKAKGKIRVVILESAFERFSLRNLGFFRRLKYHLLDMIFKERADIYFVGNDGSGCEVLAEKFKVNYLILPPSKFLFSKGNKIVAREKLKLPLNGVYVGYVGYPTEEFGFDLLWDIYRLSGKTFKLLIYPLGSKDKFLNLSKRFENGIFTSNSFEDFVSAIDIAMFPYRFGGFSSIMITLVSLGIPVVSFVGHSADKVIRNGWNGFLVDNFDVKTFAEKLKILSSNPILRETFSQSCTGFSESFMTIDEKASFIIQELMHL